MWTNQVSKSRVKSENLKKLTILITKRIYIFTLTKQGCDPSFSIFTPKKNVKLQKALNLTFTTVRRILLSEEKMKECAKSVTSLSATMNNQPAGSLRRLPQP